MKFPRLNTARILSEEEMRTFKGGACDSGCRGGCSCSCRPGCSPGNKNNNQGNGNSGSIGVGTGTNSIGVFDF